MIRKIVKISPWFFIIAIAIVFSALFFHFQSTQAQVGVNEYELGGWAWSSVYGWISLNAENTGNTQSSYSVKIDSQNVISGYGWSQNAGWICFGATCQSGNLRAPDGSVPAASLQNQKIVGWAKILSLGSDGWIHFHRGGSVTTQYESQACYNCQPSCETWTRSCDGEGNCQNVPPCVRFSTTYFDSCKTCFSTTYFDGQVQPTGYSGEAAVGGSGYACSVCGNSTDKRCQKRTNALGDSRITCPASSCGSCERYGADYDESSSALIGWAWGGAADNAGGAGWVHFPAGLSYIAFPWLETKFGSIYTPEDVRQKAAAGGVNATYCIFAQSLERVNTGNCEQTISDIDLNAIGNTTYRNALGRIDLAGLTTVANTSGGVNYNRFGNKIVNLSANMSGSYQLENQVYVTAGDLTINGNVIFNDGVSHGNGLIVVNGNLNISKEITYGASSGADLKKLASVAWVVKGDVIVNSVIKNVAGAFIILGNGSACQIKSGSDLNYPQYDANKCGVFFSGISAESLTVRGLLVAKAFDFGRTYAAVSRGAEQIVYDGRLSANPPPGLKDFVSDLPVIRDFSY